MARERRSRQVLHRQAIELVYKVFSYFKREADTDMPVHDVAKAQKPVFQFLSLPSPSRSVKTPTEYTRRHENAAKHNYHELALKYELQRRHTQNHKYLL
jgi:hypothetical protein